MYGNADFLSSLGAEPEHGKKRQKPIPSTRGTVNFDLGDESSMVKLFGSFLKRNAGRVAITLGVGALVSAAMVNAAFLQSSKHPAPLFVQHKKPDVSKSDTAAIPKPREIILSKDDRPVVADPIIIEVQKHLAARGYYNSKIDGVMGARTSAAIGVYQRAFDIPVTNAANRALVEHIRLSAPDKEYHAKARERVAAAAAKRQADNATAVSTQTADLVITDPEHIKQVQQALSRLGFNLVADGVVGSNTNNAVVEFKKRQGLSPDERITLALFNKLIKLKKL